MPPTEDEYVLFDAGVFIGALLTGDPRYTEELRCENYFCARKFFECISLSGDPEQRSDEGRLPSCIISG